MAAATAGRITSPSGRTNRPRPPATSSQPANGATIGRTARDEPRASRGRRDVGEHGEHDGDRHQTSCRRSSGMSSNSSSRGEHAARAEQDDADHVQHPVQLAGLARRRRQVRVRRPVARPSHSRPANRSVSRPSASRSGPPRSPRTSRKYSIDSTSRPSLLDSAKNSAVDGDLGRVRAQGGHLGAHRSRSRRPPWSPRRPRRRTGRSSTLATPKGRSLLADRVEAALQQRLRRWPSSRPSHLPRLARAVPGSAARSTAAIATRCAMMWSGWP